MLEARKNQICKKFQEIFEILELKDHHWQKTAMRLAESYVQEIFPELSEPPSLQLYPQKGAKGQLIFLNKVPIHSFCAHHLVPMIGHAELAYIPSSDAILGFSKVHELVVSLCQRPQLQEKLTHDIVTTLSLALQTEDIAICTKIMHTCIAQKKESIDASTIDNYFFSGVFKKESYQHHFFSRLSTFSAAKKEGCSKVLSLF